MRKLLVILLVLAFVLPTLAQVRVMGNKELFTTQICTLGGIATDFTCNPTTTTDSCFAWSNTVNLTIPVYAGVGMKAYDVWANRAWIELSYVDSTPVNNSLSVGGDTLMVYVYGGGADGGVTNTILDTLAFGMPTGALKKPITKEISVHNWPQFDNSFTATNYLARDESGLGLGDSLAWHVSRLPYSARFKLCADGSLATGLPTGPYATAYDDTLMVRMRLILEANQSGMPGW